jgi:hypothetical protein
LLSNTLPPGTHTLVLTALEANSGGRGAVNFDAIDVFGIPEPSSVALFGIVLVATCAIRRRGSVSRR